jgi:hypothetical protein
MRFILRKYVDANTAAEALELDKKTAVHDVYLKDGEEPERGGCGARSWILAGHGSRPIP